MSIVSTHLFYYLHNEKSREKDKDLKTDSVRSDYFIDLPFHEKNHPQREDNYRFRRKRFQDFEPPRDPRQNTHEDLHQKS